MSSRILACISPVPLSIDDAVRFVSGPEIGGLVTFIGTARTKSSVHAERVVERLEYEAYVPMAESMLTTIAEEILAAFEIDRIALMHRTGTVLIGESAIVTAVSARHRAPAFDACRAAVDAVKQRLPVWKKEVYRDGSEWIGEGA